MRRLLLCLLLATLAAVSGDYLAGRVQVDQKVYAAQSSVAVPFVSSADDRAALLERRADLAQWYRNAARVERERAEVEAARVAAAEKAAAAAAPPPEVHTPAPGPCGGWEGLIRAYFVDVATACRVMMCESGGNPTVHNSRSSASGLFQFLDSTWQSTTGTPGPAANYPPETQVAAAAKLHSSSGWRPWSCY